MVKILEPFPDRAALEAYFSQASVVQHYSKAVVEVGLWLSEEKVFNRLFAKEATILDIGTGAGRIPIGLYQQGYQNVIGIDCCQPMIDRARQLAKRLDFGLSFQRANA